MKKIVSYILVFCSLIFIPSVIHADVLVNDDFLGTIVSSTNWHIPTWVSATDGTFIGRTQFRTTQNSTLPATSNSNALITLQTYNKTGFSFYGSEIISNKTFTASQNLDIKIKAKMNSTTPGMVGGIFLYSLKPGSNTLHDEIDFEILTNKPDQVQTNIYGNEPLGAGHPQFVYYPSGTINDYHIYEIKWSTNGVSWLIDGIVVRTETSIIPAGPMNFYFNMWAPDQGWAEAYSANIQPTSVATANQSYAMSIDSISIQTPTLNSITIDPTSANLIVGGATQQLTASTFDQSGNPITATVTWTSSNSAIAKVSTTGLVTAVAAGTASITASNGTVKSAPTTITVTKLVPKTITISPTSVALTVAGTGQQLTATILDQNGNPITAAVTWTSSNSAIAKVSTAGLVTPVSAGIVNITASNGTVKSAPVSVTVNKQVLQTITITPSTSNLIASGATLQLKATNLDQNNNPMTATVVWSSDKPTIAKVSTAGLVTPIAPGTANISASSDGITSNPSVITVASPSIQITSVPKIGATTGSAVGKITGVLSTNYSLYKVAVFIKVAGGWWNKPTWASPLTTIQSTGIWSTNIVTGGNDKDATEVRAYLVNTGYTVPQVSGNTSIPSAMDIFPYATVTR